MRVFFLTFAALSLAAAGDFETGKRAYQSGDFSTAMREWQPLADQGAPFAAYNLGLMYARGQGVTKDFAQAAKYYRIAADKGIVEAEYNLGMLYSSGSGVPKDDAEAMKWFRQAAEKGDVNAENNVGALYDAGSGSFKNYAEAEKWYRKAAEQGNANAQFNLGVIYDTGLGVTPDFAEAQKWYRKAAEQWNEGALCNLAILYYNGDGVKRDLVLSHEYYLLAKEAGDPRASNLIALTTEKLTKKQIAQAEQMAEKFKDSHKEQIIAAKNPATKPPAPLAESTEHIAIRTAQEGDSEWTGVNRIVAVGDLHGDHRQFTGVLRSAGLIDVQDNWSGGATHLVQTGDAIGQGADSRRIMDLLMKLEKQAQEAGGRVHCLIGDHEAMEMYGDLRFVSPAAFQEFRGADSDQLRDRYYAKYQQTNQSVMPREDWNRQHPPGFFEQREAFSPDGAYGRWIRSHNTVVEIDGMLFSHAGLSARYAGYSLDDLNRKVKEELADPNSRQGGILTDLQGPLWYRGFMGNDPEGIDIVLRRFQAEREVVGHVDSGAAITPRFDGRVILIDVGLSRVQDNNGRQACLIIEGNKMFALHRGQKLELPKDEGPDMLRYLKQAAALDPAPSPLAERIKQLEAHAVQ